VKRQFDVESAASAMVVLEALRAFSTNLPSRGRVRPDHTTGVSVTVTPPRFTLQYRRTYRDWLAPVCTGVVSANGEGAHIRATIRNSRGLLVLPILWFGLAAYAWVRRGGPDVIGLVIILVACLGLGVMALVQASFSVVKHEAEADGLAALVRRAAQLESNA